MFAEDAEDKWLNLYCASTVRLLRHAERCTTNNRKTESQDYMRMAYDRLFDIVSMLAARTQTMS